MSLRTARLLAIAQALDAGGVVVLLADRDSASALACGEGLRHTVLPHLLRQGPGDALEVFAVGLWPVGDGLDVAVTRGTSADVLEAVAAWLLLMGVPARCPQVALGVCVDDEARARALADEACAVLGELGAQVREVGQGLH